MNKKCSQKVKYKEQTLGWQLTIFFLLERNPDPDEGLQRPQSPCLLLGIWMTDSCWTSRMLSVGK